MKLKRILTLTAAAALTTALLTGCPWEQDDAASSEPSSSSSSSSRPEPDEPDEPSKPDEPDEPENPIVDGKLTITGGSGELTEAAFEGVDKTEIIELDLSGSGYTSIGIYVFAGCTRLESINLPNSLTSIGESAFEGCTSLQSIDLPDGLTEIKMNAFDGCSSLQRIILPDGLTEIDQRTFNGCASLESVYLPDSLKTIGLQAFKGCTKLTNIYVGDGILKAEIGVNAFDGVGGLEEEPITVTVYYPSEWDELGDEAKQEKLEAVRAKLQEGGLQTDLDDYEPESSPDSEYDKLTQTTPELPDGVKGLMEAARLFGL